MRVGVIGSNSVPPFVKSDGYPGGEFLSDAPFSNLVSERLASSLAREKNGGAPGTHCWHIRLISPRSGDSGLFSDWFLLGAG